MSFSISRDGFVSRDILIDGEELSTILDDQEKVQDILQALACDVSPEKILERSKYATVQDDSFPDFLKGPAGLATTIFLETVAGENLQRSLRSADDNSKFRTKVSGKICDFIFIPDPKDPSEFPRKGSGHISIEVISDEYNDDQALIDCSPSKTKFLHWDIEVCEYTVHVRDDNCFPNLPFPELQGGSPPKVTFPSSALDPDDSRSIWCRGLDHKLFAGGLKDDGQANIIIHDIYESIDGSDLVRLKSQGAERDPKYEVTQESCVDIMFKGYPPSTGLPSQREYCLGRCKEPGIVNTGM